MKKYTEILGFSAVWMPYRLVVSYVSTILVGLFLVINQLNAQILVL